MYSLLKEILKITMGITISIVAPLLILFVFIYMVYLIKTILYILSFAIHEISIQLSILVFIILSTFLLIQWYKRINIWMVFLYFFIYTFISYIVNIYLIEKRISNIAVHKYGVEPSYLGIDFSIDDEYRDPHAVIYKNNKSYYWSFKKNDFVLNTNPRLHI